MSPVDLKGEHDIKCQDEITLDEVNSYRFIFIEALFILKYFKYLTTGIA